MIELQAASKTYAANGASVAAVVDATLQLDQGDFLIVVGRSGSGKTTLLNLMAGLTRPTSGRVSLEGVDIWSGGDAKQSRLRNESMGFVFQFPSLLSFLTVEENLVLPTGLGGASSGTPAHERAAHYLDEVGLAEKRKAYPRHLSAGQQQRAVIARSLMNEPRLLFADEPTSNLDERTEREILDLFAEIHASMSMTIALVTHTKQLLSYGTRAVEMAEGRIAEEKEFLP